jgi:superoxide reductase
MCKNKFYVCEHCGNLVELIHDAGVPITCCSQKMKLLEPGAVDASREKHLPVISVDKNTVTVNVGSVEHPMTEEHGIRWVCLQTDRGIQRKCLAIGQAPIVTFALSDEKPIAVYAYCNLHGLWKADNVIIPVCDLKPVDTESNENYLVCKCNNVSYFDIIKAVHSESDIKNLLSVFDKVKNTTHCSTGCGGCYNKVMDIISEEMHK